MSRSKDMIILNFLNSARTLTTKTFKHSASGETSPSVHAQVTNWAILSYSERPKVIYEEVKWIDVDLGCVSLFSKFSSEFCEIGWPPYVGSLWICSKNIWKVIWTKNLTNWCTGDLLKSIQIIFCILLGTKGKRIVRVVITHKWDWSQF